MKTDISIGRVSSLLVWCGKSHHGKTSVKPKTKKLSTISDQTLINLILLANGTLHSQLRP